jgi:hypothetical protein|tara:strand:- start:159 stop:413 length:255 start_codon:yes stop_codon:yes gene_type:complete
MDNAPHGPDNDLIARRTALQVELEAAESGVYDWDLSGKIFTDIREIDNQLGAMDMSDDQLLAGWENGGRSAQVAIANERFSRGI